MNSPVGIRSLALSLPNIIRTKDYWLEKTPNLITPNKPRRIRTPKATQLSHNGLDIWSQEVAPYLPDPFRGSIERRVLAPNESSLTLEYQAAKEALDAAQLAPEDVDLAIVASLFPEHIGPGSAAYLARKLKLNCPAWNLESTCSSAIIALQNACALVRSREYRNVLVVVSHIGSNSVDEEDTLSWSIGDGAGAFVVDSLQPNQGILATKIVPTVATCGAYSYELVTDAEGKSRIRTRTGENASMLAETAVDCVRSCCEGAAAAAGVTFEQIDFFAFNTPTAWYASVCTRALGIDPERTINLYPRYANIGPVFPIANLYHAAQAGKIHENDLVLVYTNGAAATAAAMVMRWGDVALGSVPASPISVTWEQERIYLAIKTEKLSTGATSFLTREQLLATKPEEQQQMLEGYLLECLASSLQLPINEFNSQQSLGTLLDSLMAIVLRSRIETDLQVRVPMEKFFGESTVTQLAELLLNQLALANLISSESVVVGDVNEKEEREILSF
ncbi:MAG: 3-oxoacyl-[acyl-carrier-protein] synthase III C-terminal domain-containing protein [Cyanobacteriota bacterium]